MTNGKKFSLKNGVLKTRSLLRLIVQVPMYEETGYVTLDINGQLKSNLDTQDATAHTVRET